MRLFRRDGGAGSVAGGGRLDGWFTALDRLDGAQLLALAAAWRAVDRAEREAAWETVREVTAAENLTGAVDDVRDRATHWATRADNRPPLYHLAEDDLVNADIRAAAAAAIVDTALAIALDGRLSRRARRTLAGAWESAIGPLPRASGTGPAER